MHLFFEIGITAQTLISTALATTRKTAPDKYEAITVMNITYLGSEWGLSISTLASEAVIGAQVVISLSPSGGLLN